MLRKQAIIFGVILLIVVASCNPSPDKDDKDKDSGKKAETEGCLWKGTSPFCDGGCNVVGHFVKETSKTGDGAECLTGIKVLCCPGPK